MIVTKKINLLTIILFIIFCFSSCKKEPVIMEASKTYPNVHPEIWVFFERFEQAAAKRGIYVDLANSDIIANIKKIETRVSSNSIGMCYYSSLAPNEIIIDKLFWKRASMLRKELAIFHELGHCYLLLEHREGSYQDGRCKSIMRSGTRNCMDMYLSDNRDEYLNELFL